MTADEREKQIKDILKLIRATKMPEDKVVVYEARIRAGNDERVLQLRSALVKNLTKLVYGHEVRVTN